MNQATIYIDPVGCSKVGWTQAAGMPGDTRFLFKTPGNIAYPSVVALNPQLVLRPHTALTVYAYDIAIDDPVGAAGTATIPGSVMMDRFNVEVYERNSIGTPQRMLAAGRVELNGYGYTQTGPLGPATFSVGPAGPTGPAGADGAAGAPGAAGMRGSRWYTAVGPPTGAVPDDRVQGDMYLDESNGDVWRWDAASASWLAYRGS